MNKTRYQQMKADRFNRIVAYLKRTGGATSSGIARRCDVPIGTMPGYVKEMMTAGLIGRTQGANRTFTYYARKEEYHGLDAHAKAATGDA